MNTRSTSTSYNGLTPLQASKSHCYCSLFFVCPKERCQPSGIRTQDRSSAADPVSSEHPPTVVCVWDNDSDSIFVTLETQFVKESGPS
ncbi:hypothetical protein ACOMHN_013824 [Nucella lapillus]